MLARVLVALGVVLCSERSAHAQTTTSTAPAQWGDASASLVERFGYLAINGAERGKSGLARGPGLELRFMMPVGWGAYYRLVHVATANKDEADWYHGEFIAGLSRRLMSVGSARPWTTRASARFDFGVGWTQTGTNKQCTQSFVPFGTHCSTPGGRPRNVQGDALAIEGRIGADFGLGPLFVGVDVGMSAYLNMWTGSNSASLPWLFLSPSGQLRLGVALPF
jgi:hypothetical protein